MEQVIKTKNLIETELIDIVNQITWLRLRQFIHEYSSLRKVVSAGGVRIIPQNRKMFLPAIVKKCSEDEKILKGLFVIWFNEQSAYYDCLAPFFQSEEHKELLEERGGQELEYVINEKYFCEFLDVVKSSDIDKFLLLSPVNFTPKQKEMLENLRKDKNETSNLEQASAKLTDRRSRNGAKALTKGELKHHKKELKKIMEENAKLLKENQRLSKIRKEQNRKRADWIRQINDIKAKHADELKAFENRYSALKKRAVETEEENQKMAGLISNNNNNIRRLENAITMLESESERHFYQIFEKLDTEQIISDLNASDEVIDLLSTVIRPPTADGSDGQKENSFTLRDFWHHLIEKERKIIGKILEISAREVADGMYFMDWDNQIDEFNDLKCSLSTRTYLVDMLYNILRQYYDQKY